MAGRVRLLFGIVGVVVVSLASPHGTLALGTESDSSSPDGVFAVGEELVYNVRYAFIDIGQIRIRVLDRVEEGDAVYYKAIANIASYSGVPFVNLHAIYESAIDERGYSRWFRSRNKDRAGWEYFVYTFDYDNGNLRIENGRWGGGGAVIRDSLTLETKYQDGLSLYYFARRNIRANRRMVVPTLIGEERVRTVITFENKVTSARVKALDYPIEVIEFDGNAEFVGIFGLTGDFRGWFSNDEARVPIAATMKVLIGNIRVELMRWHRPGWEPPKYTGSVTR